MDAVYNSDPATAIIPLEFAAEIVQYGAGRPTPQPVPGYTLAECTTPAVDLVEHKVTWKGKADLTELLGQPVFIRFYLKNCGIYSLRFRRP